MYAVKWTENAVATPSMFAQHRRCYPVVRPVLARARAALMDRGQLIRRLRFPSSPQVPHRATRGTDEPGSNVAATISRFSDSGHARCRRRLFVPITEFVDTSSHHAAFGDRSVVHPVASRKGGPRRRETLQHHWYGVFARFRQSFHT